MHTVLYAKRNHWKRADDKYTFQSATGGRPGCAPQGRSPGHRPHAPVSYTHLWLQVDGRKPDLLRKLLAIKDVHVILNVVGASAATERVFGGAPSRDALAETIELVRATPDGIIRFFAVPQPGEDGTWAWPDRAEALAAAKMVFEACNAPTLPYVIAAVTPDMAWDMRGLEALPEQTLLVYRSASRQFLFKADVAK